MSSTPSFDMGELIDGINILFSKPAIGVIGTLIFVILISILICTILFMILVYVVRKMALKNGAIEPFTMPSFRRFGKRKY
jgi:hypothetical protein